MREVLILYLKVVKIEMGHIIIMPQWLARLTHLQTMDDCQVWTLSKTAIVPLSNTIYSHLSVVVGSRNAFDRALFACMQNCFFQDRIQINKYRQQMVFISRVQYTDPSKPAKLNDAFGIWNQLASFIRFTLVTMILRWDIWTRKGIVYLKTQSKTRIVNI